MNDKRIILASRSPRRFELLQKVVAAERIMVFPAAVVESMLPGEDGRSFTRRIAFVKANDAARNVPDQLPGDVVLGADTVIELDHELIGKPCDDKSAFRILARLRHRQHKVITGVCLLKIGDRSQKIFAVSSEVTMRDYSDQEIRDYIRSGEPMDKAGAYAIQGKGKDLIEEYRGSYTNIVGLPIDEIAAELRDLDCAEILL